MLIRITHQPLDEAEARRAVSRPANGAVLVFHGLVRDHHEGHAVEHVEYHAYVAMAERELLAVCSEVGARHGVVDVAVLHRTGKVAVGEASLIVAIGSPHRQEAFTAGLELIDTLKARVPIWKKEFGPGGARWQDGILPPTATG